MSVFRNHRRDRGCRSYCNREIDSRYARLRKRYGSGRWRKLKGKATVRLRSGVERQAEIHWYEAHGIGKVKFKIKQFLD